MIVVRAPARADRIRQAQLGADLRHQAAGESAAQNIHRDFERRVVGIAQRAAQLAHRKEGLRDVGLLGQENAGSGLGRHRRETAAPEAVPLSNRRTVLRVWPRISGAEKSPYTASMMFLGK